MLPRVALDRVLCVGELISVYVILYICLCFCWFLVRFGVRECGLFAAVAATFGRTGRCGMWRAAAADDDDSGSRLKRMQICIFHVHCSILYVLSLRWMHTPPPHMHMRRIAHSGISFAHSVHAHSSRWLFYFGDSQFDYA